MAEHPHLAYRADVDGLRAVAITSVVFFHAFPNWVTGGFFGVDVFFVISGYLITGLILKGAPLGITLRSFYARRVRRLFPALILVLFSCLIVGWFMMLTEEYKQLGKQVVAGAAFVENFSLLGEVGYFDTTAALKPLLHLWSLGIEEQFYLVWPVLLILCLRFRLNHMALAVGLTTLSFAASIAITEKHAALAFYSPFTRFWELMAGAMLAQAQHYRLLSGEATAASRGSRLLADIVAVCGVLLIGIATLVVNESFVLPGSWALLPTIGTVLLIRAGPDAWLNRNVLASRPLVFIGLISYPLYLWHWPLLSFARVLEGTTMGTGLRLALIAIAFALSCLTYWLVEKRIRAKPHWGVTFALGCLLAFIGAVGYNIYSRDGLEFRLKGSALQRVKFNTSLYYEHQCRKDLPFTRNSFCMRGNDHRPITVALIGDSHAMNLYPGLGNRYAQRGDNLALFGVGGGIPFYGVERIVNGQKTSYYSPLYKAILDYVVMDKNISTVVLLNKAVSLDVEPDELRYERDPDNSNSLDVYGKAMSDTLRTLLDAGKKVIFVIDNPRMDFDPAACVSRIPDVAPAKALCAIPRESYESRTRLYRRKVRDILAQYPVVETWDLAESLCDKRYCWAMRDGKMFYGRDGHHLTIDASYWLAEQLPLNKPR